MSNSSRETMPWLRVLTEGVVIVGSILLAFGIQAWWDGRNKAGRRKALLLGLVESGLPFSRTLPDPDPDLERLAVGDG